MRRYGIVIAAASIGMLLLTGNGFAQTPTTALTGKMDMFNYLLGTTWRCQSRTVDTNGRVVRTSQTTATFDVVPPNALHVHLVSDTLTSDEYFGYVPDVGGYWSSIANSAGLSMTQASPDGVTFDGSTTLGSSKISLRSIYTKNDDTHASVRQISTVNGVQQDSSGTCTRQ